MFTCKHLEFLACSIRRLDLAPADKFKVAKGLADDLALTNPRFNRAKFYAACGVEEAKRFDAVGFIMAAECGEIEDEEAFVAGVQGLIDSGTIRSLQGSWQRTAQSLIERGLCHA